MDEEEVRVLGTTFARRMPSDADLAGAHKATADDEARQIDAGKAKGEYLLAKLKRTGELAVVTPEGKHITIRHMNSGGPNGYAIDKGDGKKLKKSDYKLRSAETMVNWLADVLEASPEAAEVPIHLAKEDAIAADSPEAMWEVARTALNSAHEWHAGAELPKGKNAKGIVEELGKVISTKFALPRGIVEGWGTNMRYMIKSTSAMIERARELGYDKIEGPSVPYRAVIENAEKPNLEPASVVANKIATGANGGGEARSLIANADGTKQAEVESRYVANILSMYPDATPFISSGDEPLPFESKGEVVGLVMPLAPDERSIHPHPRPKLSDVLEAGPYSADDVRDDGGNLTVGVRGTANFARVEIGRCGGAYTIDHHALTDRRYSTYTQAVNAAKEILAHAHGTGEDGRLLFKPKGEKSELSGDEKARVEYHKNLRDRVAVAKKAKRKNGVRVAETEATTADGTAGTTDAARIYLPVGEHFGVEKVKGGYRVAHLPSGLRAGTWSTRNTAIGHALALGDMPGVDWSKSAAHLTAIAATTAAFEATALPPHLAGKADTSAPPKHS